MLKRFDDWLDDLLGTVFVDYLPLTIIVLFFILSVVVVGIVGTGGEEKPTRATQTSGAKCVASCEKNGMEAERVRIDVDADGAVRECWCKPRVTP